MSFTKKVLFSMVTGIIVGVLINNFFLPSYFIESILINHVLHTISSLFLILLKMIVLPLIFVSIISASNNNPPLKSIPKFNPRVKSRTIVKIINIDDKKIKGFLNFKKFTFELIGIKFSNLNIIFNTFC